MCMLNLGGNRFLHDVSILGELKELEVLILSHTGIKEIPQEIGQLINLRRLEVKCCDDLSHIAPGVISKLRWLEELHIGLFPMEEGKYNSLVELDKLSNLTFLDLAVPHNYLIPEGDWFARLEGLVIQIGGREQIYDLAGVVHQKTLILGFPNIDIEPLPQIKKLIEVINDGIVLESIAKLDNIMPTIFCEGFEDLKSIMISRCDNLLCLMDWHQMQTVHSSICVNVAKTEKRFLSKLEHLVLDQLDKLSVMWNHADQYISLNNLVTVDIIYCDKLVRLFSVGVAHSLVNLQKLKIKECGSLQEVIWDGDDETSSSEHGMVVKATNLVFPSLLQISLLSLTSLISFCSTKSNIKYPSLVNVKIYNCDKMERWGHGTHDTPRLNFENNVEPPSTINDSVIKYKEFLDSDQNPRTFYSASRMTRMILEVVGLKEWPITEKSKPGFFWRCSWIKLTEPPLIQLSPEVVEVAEVMELHES